MTKSKPQIVKCRAVIFDLDGTLLDTLTDIANAANRAMAAHGYPPHPRKAYQNFIGDGAKMLITRSLPEGCRKADIIESCTRDFITDYNHHWDRATRPYTGIMELIKALKDRAFQLSVVTNKPHRFTGAMMDHYFTNTSFAAILGQQDGIPMKPHPQQALAAAEHMGVNPSACIFIGDSALDMETARRAGMLPIGAGWGFRSIQELLEAGAMTVLNHPADLLQLL
ncbi:MAG: HAD family hydrolase [Desulfobacteraceae bacterium]|jgi:phosphoglycolate phosphatase